jgi:hypothetical protein
MNTVGLPMPRGTWLILVVAVLPVLVSQVASAAPGYPVEDPQGTSYTVAYDPPSHMLTVTSPTTSTLVQFGAADVSDAVGATTPQVNHGQVMKQLHELIEGRNSGCLTSAVAKSTLGKGDDQVPADEIGTLIVDVDCSETDGSAGHGSGKPDDAPGKSDTAEAEKPRGNSDKAPGKDK